MTIDEKWGKLAVKLEHQECIGRRSREVELDISWVSCGVYEIDYWRPRDAQPHYVMVAEDWYPPDVQISITPEQFDKVVELLPDSIKNDRGNCYKPFYEDYSLDPGMFDIGYDRLFQAFRSPHKDCDNVYLVLTIFLRGIPTPSRQVLGLSLEDFGRLKDFLHSKKDLIFYSGCRVSMPSKTLTALTALEKAMGE